MIITIKGADFSSANIGTLSTYIISKSIGSGASFDIPNFVDKNSSVNWTITLNEGYTFGTYSVTMGGEVITPSVVDNVMTISIAEVTGNVRIVVATVNENTGEEDLPTIPDTPQTPTIYSTPVGYQIFEFGDFKLITNTSLVNSYKGNIYGVDVSNYVGKEITISAEQAYVKGNSEYGDAYYNFFVSGALDEIEPEDLPNIASYPFTDVGNGKALILDKSIIVEKFDINTSDTNQKYTSKTVTVPTGAKYLYFTSCHQNTTLDGTITFN